MPPPEQRLLLPLTLGLWLCVLLMLRCTPRLSIDSNAIDSNAIDSDAIDFDAGYTLLLLVVLVGRVEGHDIVHEMKVRLADASVHLSHTHEESKKKKEGEHAKKKMGSGT